MKVWVLNPPFLKKYSRPQRSPAVTKSGTIYSPIWLAYCVEVLEEEGHDVTFMDAPVTDYELVGFPGETRTSIAKTIELAIKLNPDTVQFYPVMVYPGTEAYDEYQQKGWLTASGYHDWLTPEGLHNCVVRNETLTSKDLVRLCDYGRRRFYLRPRYLLYKLLQIIAQLSEAGRTAKAARTFFKYLIFGSRV